MSEGGFFFLIITSLNDNASFNCCLSSWKRQWGDNIDSTFMFYFRTRWQPSSELPPRSSLPPPPVRHASLKSDKTTSSKLSRPICSLPPPVGSIRKTTTPQSLALAPLCSHLPCTIHHTPPPALSITLLHPALTITALHGHYPTTLAFFWTPCKDLVQFSDEAGRRRCSPPYLDRTLSPNRSREGTPMISPRSSPSISPSLLMPAPPPCSPEKLEGSPLHTAAVPPRPARSTPSRRRQRKASGPNYEVKTL